MSFVSIESYMLQFLFWFIIFFKLAIPNLFLDLILSPLGGEQCEGSPLHYLRF